jgi:hypothetical protein
MNLPQLLRLISQLESLSQPTGTPGSLRRTQYSSDRLDNCGRFGSIQPALSISGCKIASPLCE